MLKEVPFQFDLKTNPKVSDMIPEIGNFSLCPDDDNVLMTLLESSSKKSMRSYILVDIFAKTKSHTIRSDEIISENEKILSRKDFMNEIVNLRKENDVSWIDTDIVGFDWEKINSLSSDKLIAELQMVPFKKADVAIYNKKKGNNYITYRITD